MASQSVANGVTPANSSVATMGEGYASTDTDDGPTVSAHLASTVTWPIAQGWSVQ